MKKFKLAFRLMGALVILAATYALGYWSGLNDQGPQQRALVTVRRTPGNPNPTGASYEWYNIRFPWEAARLRADEKRLTDKGVEHYVAEGVYSWELRVKPDPKRMNSHR